MTVLSPKRLAAVAAVVLALPINSVANHIDYLVDGGFILVADSISGPASDSQIGSAGNIIGTERDVDLSFVSGSGILTSALLVPPGPGPVGPDTSKVLLFDNSVSSVGTMVLTYDGVADTGFGPADFTAWNNITVAIPAVQGAGTLSVRVSDTSSNTGILTGVVNSAGTYSFPFANANYSSVDFTMVDSVQATLQTTAAASDFAIAQITREVQPGSNNIPEPASAILVLLAAVGSIALARRQRA